MPYSTLVKVTFVVYHIYTVVFSKSTSENGRMFVYILLLLPLEVLVCLKSFHFSWGIGCCQGTCKEINIHIYTERFD